MSLYDSFAKNLRRYCETQESIAGICRAAGINRPQFNRYLAGTSIPNAANLHKICRVLRIEEWQLIGTERAEGPAKTGIANERLNKAAGNLFSGFELLLKDAAGRKQSIFEPGLYFLFSRMGHLQNFVVRTLLQIKPTDGGLAFTRLSRLRRKESGQYLTRGKHVGIVLPDETCDNLIGRNLLPPHQLSMVAIEHWQAAPGMHVGQMLTRTSNSVISTRVLVQRVPVGMTLRQACASLGLIPERDNSLSAIANELLFNTLADSGGVIMSPDADEVANNLATLSVKPRLAKTT